MSGRLWIFLLSFLITSHLGLVACSDEPSKEAIRQLAQCLTENDWVMYGSITCSACRAQKKAFGEVFEEINEVECNPNAPNTQVDLCLSKKIEITPTWIQERNGADLARIEGYQLLEDLDRLSNCERL